MTATLPTTTAKDGRLRFHSAEAGKLVWKSWEEMTIGERAQVREQYPGYAAEYEGTGDPGRYANEVEYYEARIAALSEMARNGQTPVDRFRARSAMQQYRRGIEVLREAETIPEDSRAWFAVVPGELSTHVPPFFGGSSIEIEYPNDILIHTTDHVYDTSDPVRIAWMRQLVRTPDPGNNYTLYEREIGDYPLLDDHGDLIGFANVQTYRNHEAARSARTTVSY